MTTHVKARCLKYICQRPPIQACLSWVRTWSTCCRIIFVIILLRFQMSSGSSKMSVLHFVTYHQHATLQMPRQRWCVCVTRRTLGKGVGSTGHPALACWRGAWLLLDAGPGGGSLESFEVVHGWATTQTSLMLRGGHKWSIESTHAK